MLNDAMDLVDRLGVLAQNDKITEVDRERLSWVVAELTTLDTISNDANLHQAVKAYILIQLDRVVISVWPLQPELAEELTQLAATLDTVY